MSRRFTSPLFLFCGAAFMLAVVWFFYLQAEPPPADVAVATAASSPARTGSPGPGKLVSGNSGSAAEDGPDLDEIPAGVIRVDDRGQLIIDVQLHNAMDSYLLHSDLPTRQAAAVKLRGYLKRKLPASANVDAQALVTRYLDYMEQHDAALGRTRFVALEGDGLSAQGAQQFSAWQAQRKTMRQVILGATVYKEWFEADDARCAAALAARQAQAAPADASPSDAEQGQEALDCATEMGRSFAVVESAERQWTRHWALYRDELRRLPERDPTLREQALANLRQRIFTSEAERQRAENMNLP